MNENLVNQFHLQSTEKYVIMTDMKRSRDEDESVASEKAVNLIGFLNRRYRSDIFLPFQVYRGYDEIVGILKSIEHLCPLFIDVAIMLHPFITRIAVVHGKINYQYSNTEVNVWNSGKLGDEGFITMGGDAFVKANDILGKLKKIDRLFKLQGRNELLDRSLSLNIEEMLREIKNWSKIENDVVNLYRKFRNQVKVAEQLGISQQRVSKIFQQISYSHIDFQEAEINAIFHEYHKNYLTN